MAFKYAFNTWVYSSFPCWVPSYSLDETIRRIAAIGYDGIEIGCAAPHAWPAHLSKSRRADLRSLMADAGLKPVSLLPAPGGGPGNNPASLLEEERKSTIQHYKDVVDLAQDLGADRVLYICGWRSFGTGFDQAWDWTRSALAEIAAHALDKGIGVSIEPTSADSNLVDTPGQALKLRDTDRLPPGEGTIDWHGVMAALKRIGFGGYITMEAGFNTRAVEPDRVARSALTYLRDVESKL
jgi:protein FrlC